MWQIVGKILERVGGSMEQGAAMANQRALPAPTPKAPEAGAPSLREVFAPKSMPMAGPEPTPSQSAQPAPAPAPAAQALAQPAAGPGQPAQPAPSQSASNKNLKNALNKNRLGLLKNAFAAAG